MTPPRGAPAVLLKVKESYKLWLPIYKNFPRIEREGLGREVDRRLLKLLCLVFKASYRDPKTKLPMLAEAGEVNDEIKFFLQHAWELKLIHTTKYSELAMLLEEVGAMLYRWRRGLESKLPRQGEGERL